MTQKPDFEALFTASPYPYLLVTTDLTIIGANTAYLHSTGRKAEDIVGKHIFDAFPANPADPGSTNLREVRASIERAIATRLPHTTAFLRYAVPHETPEGRVFEERYWSTVHTPVFDAHGEVAFVSQNAIDVTDLYTFDKASQAPSLERNLKSGQDVKDFNRLQMHEAMTRILNDERSHLRSLFNQAPGFIAVIMGRKHVFEMVNEAYYQLVGHRDILGKPVFDALPEVAGQGFEQLLNTVFETGQPFVGRGLKVWMQREPSGPLSEIYVDVLYQPLFAPDGSVSGIFAQGHDVTETYNAQLAKRAADERLQDGMLAARMVVWDWDLESGRVSFSDNAAFVFGASWDNIEQMWATVHPDDAERLADAQKRAIAEKSEYHEASRLIRPDNGEIIWLDNRGKVLCDASGTPYAFRGVSLDITERKRVESELARVNQALAEQVEQLKKARERQTFRLRFADLLRRLSDPSEIFTKTSELIGRHLHVCRVLYGEYDFEKKLVTYHSNYTDGTVSELNGAYPAGSFGAANFASLEGGTTWICDDLAHDPRTAGPDTWPTFEALDIYSAVVVPLSRNGTLIACLFINDSKPRKWTDDEVRLIEDVAERIWNAVERVRAEQALLQADRRKDQFLAMLAHELRNPLAPISAAAELLKLPRLDAERIRYTSDIIGRQVNHMTGLIDDLLDVSRVTRGLVVLDKEEVDIKRVVSDAVEQVRPLIAARSHHFTVNMHPESACVVGDYKRLVQVLANLINNAAKYTPEGGNILVRMDATEECVVLSVLDDGIGISQELLPNVFELFAQAKRTPDRSQGGLGLGLALVKSLVELHGGSVAAESKGHNAGSRFTVRLPRFVKKNDGQSIQDDGNAATLASAKSLRLMVVDDNVDAAQMLAMLLETTGHQVLVEHDSQSALERARHEAFDACLLDIGLPGMDGNELARRLRAMPATKKALLVAITGYGQRFDRESAAESGFDHYLVKPANPTTLAALLADVKNS